MWNSFAEDTIADGGFLPDAEQPGDSATKKKGQVRRVQNIIPLFISYITECAEDEFTVYGKRVQMVDVIGVVRNFEVQSTKATCTIEDQSGSIQAILWLETEGDTLTAVPPVKDNCYIRVFGSVRTQEGAKMIMILKMIPVDDLNVITNHRLQILQARVYAEKAANEAVDEQPAVDEQASGAAGAEQPSGPPAAVATSASTNGSVGNGDATAEDATSQDNPHGLKPMQFKIMSLLKTGGSYTGLSRAQIVGHFGAAQAAEARATLNFLLDEGYAYTTTDNDHFKATEGF